MKLRKRATAFGMAVLAAGMLGGCRIGEDTNWVAQYHETTIPAGVYISSLLGNYYSETAEISSDVKDPLKEQVDGVSVSDKIVSASRQRLSEYIAVEQKFDEMGLTLDEQTQQVLQQNIEMFWMYVGESYEQNGVSRSSYEQTMTNTSKRMALFEKLYGEGGELEVPESELRQQFNEDWTKILVIPLYFSASEDEEVRAKNEQDTRAMIQKYYEKAKAGEDMEEIVFEAHKEASSDPDSLTKPEPGSSYTFVCKSNPQYDDTITKAIFDAPLGEPTIAESEVGMYMFVRYDINENPNDFESRKMNLTEQLRADAYSELVEEWASSLSDVTFNEKAFSRYTPSKLKV